MTALNLPLLVFLVTLQPEPGQNADLGFQHAAYDPVSRFRPLLSYMNKQFWRFLVPERELCVDETLVATKGHSIMRQYIPSKAAKFGIKLWMLCESATELFIHVRQ
jgi:hypothetical protein